MARSKIIDVNIGDRFSRWEVVSEIFYQQFPSGVRAKFVRCRCECGTESTLRLGALTSKTSASMSCGCIRAESMKSLRKTVALLSEG